MKVKRGRPLAALAAATIVTAAAWVLISSAVGGIERGHSHSPGYRGFSAFVVNPGDSATVYAATGSGIFRSTNGGETWHAANDGLTDTYVFDLALDPRNSATLYAGTESGVFKSTNGGASWRPTGLANENAIALLVDPRTPERVYAANDYGVYKSIDGGKRWIKVWRGPRVFALAVDPRRPTTIYAGSGSGVMKSVDAGATWAPMNRNLFRHETTEEAAWRLSEGFVAAFAVIPRRPQTLYLASVYGVFRSRNGARSWQRVSSGLPGHEKYRLVGSLALDPREPQTLYAGARGVFKSTNGGRRWRSLRLPQRRYVIALALDPGNPRTIYAGTSQSGGKAFKSTNGGRTWHALVVSGL
jgi:photosystem II stability/assembly factor-like uncharacterized protein